MTNSFVDAFTSLTLTPVLLSQAAWSQMTQLVQCQREQVESLAKLLGSFAGSAGYGNAATTLPKDSDLFVGKTLSVRKTMTDAQTALFGLLSLDFNPLHFNEELAARTRFQGRISHGFHTASLFSGVLSELTPWCVYLHQDMDFTAPVRPGDVITATGTIDEIDPRGVVQVSLVCRNQNEEVVVRGKAHVKKLREAYQPVEPALDTRGTAPATIR